MLAQETTTQVNQLIVAHVNPNGSIVVARVWNFTQINHLEFYGSMVAEDP